MLYYTVRIIIGFYVYFLCVSNSFKPEYNFAGNIMYSGCIRIGIPMLNSIDITFVHASLQFNLSEYSYRFQTDTL
jgi:hypothetical protein